MLKEKALQGVVQRMKGRRATRMQALAAGVGAGALVYKLSRSGDGRRDRVGRRGSRDPQDEESQDGDE